MTLTSVFCHFVLSSICLLWLLGNIQSADHKNDSCKILHGEPVHFCSCPKDCSQDDGEFNCSIGGLEELKTYTNNNACMHLPDLLDPPQLLDVKFKYNEDLQTDSKEGVTQCYIGAIEINFQLPKSINGIYPDAVQLYFQGITKDDYYTRCPRQRIFQFHNYHPDYSRDGVHPRNISYSCFYGVDSQLQEAASNRNDYKKGYYVGLKSNPGQWRNYTITINPIALVVPLSEWIPTITVSLNVTNKSLFVLVETVPVDIKVKYVSVNLHRLDPDITFPETLNGITELTTTFTNLAHGRYIVQVVYHGKLNQQNGNWTGESVEIDATSIPSEDYNVGPLKIFSMVGGCLIGLVLLVLLGITVYRKRTCKKVVFNKSLKGFILHPFCDESDYNFVEFVEQFGTLLESKCKCFLFPWKPVKSKSVSEIKQWLEDDFKSLSFIIVFYISDCYETVDINPNVYSQILIEAAKWNKTSKLHIIPIKVSMSVTLPSVIRNISSVDWDDLETIYCRMKGVERSHDKKEMIDQKWKSSKAGKSLKEIFHRLPIDAYVRNNVRPNTIEDVPPTEPCDVGCMEDIMKLAMQLNTGSKPELNETQTPDDTRETSLHSTQADVHMDSIKVINDKGMDTPITNNTQNDDNSQGFKQNGSIERKDLSSGIELGKNGRFNQLIHTDVPRNSRVPSKRPNEQQVDLSPPSCRRTGHTGRYGVGPSYHRKPHEQFETRPGYFSVDPRSDLYDTYLLRSMKSLPSQVPARDQYDQDVVYCNQHVEPIQPYYNLDHLHETFPLMEEEVHTGLFPHNIPHTNDNNHSHGNYHDYNSNSGHFHPQPLRMPLPMDPHGFHSPLTTPHSRNPMCKREIMNLNMPTCELRGHRVQCRNEPSLDSHYDHQPYYIQNDPIPDIQGERNPLLHSRHRSGADKKIDFTAHDPRPLEHESRSRSNKGHIEGDPRFHPYVTDECEVEDIKSVSQNDLSRTNFNLIGAMTPPVYDYTSEESIKSEYQEEQLMKINKESLYG